MTPEREKSLRDYIQHLPGCPQSLPKIKLDLGPGWKSESYTKPCTCGLDALLAEPARETPASSTERLPHPNQGNGMPCRCGDCEAVRRRNRERGETPASSHRKESNDDTNSVDGVSPQKTQLFSESATTGLLGQRPAHKAPSVAHSGRVESSDEVGETHASVAPLEELDICAAYEAIAERGSR